MVCHSPHGYFMLFLLSYERCRRVPPVAQTRTWRNRGGVATGLVCRSCLPDRNWDQSGRLSRKTGSWGPTVFLP